MDILLILILFVLVLFIYSGGFDLFVFRPIHIVENFNSLCPPKMISGAVSDPVYNKKHNNSYCPDSLFYDGYIYRLYKNGDVVQAFNNYSDYVRYHNFMNVNYNTKGTSCKPLTPINAGSVRPDYNSDIHLNPSNVFPREFNIENFTNPSTLSPEVLKILKEEIPILFRDWSEKVDKESSCNSLGEKLIEELNKYIKLKIEEKISDPIQEFPFINFGGQDPNHIFNPINKSLSDLEKAEILRDVIRNLPSDCSSFSSTTTTSTSEDIPADKPTSTTKTLTIEDARQQIEDLYVSYLLKNKECVNKILDKSSEFSQKFKHSYELHLQDQFKSQLGYLPMKSDISKMSQKELQVYIGILSNLPNCNALIGKYYPSTLSSPSTSIPVAVSPKGSSGSWNVSITPPSDSSITIKSDADKILDAVISQNRGSVTSNPQGDRKITPSDAPYWNYLANIGKYLQEVALTNMIKNNTTTTTTELPDILKQKYLDEERKIKEKIQEDKNKEDNINKQSAKELENKYYATEPDIDWKDPKYQLKHDMTDNFPFSPDYSNKHMEPDLKSASAYGWSFVPPQFWSVPQKRPPVCLPNKGTEAKVVPVYDQSVPLDALEWSKVLPEVVYDRDYNPDYWSPGWKFQDQANYPKFTNGKNFSSEYYNYNKAEPTSK